MTRDELIEAVALKLWPDMPFNVRAVMTRDLPKFLDALDALGQGPKRVAELERALRKSTAMLERIAAGREWGAIEKQVDDNRAALKGQSNE